MLLVKNYIVFTLAIALVAAVIIYSMIFMENTFLGAAKTENLLKKENILKLGEYAQLDEDELFGKKGFFEILNNKNELIYTSNSFKSTQIYTLGEIECMKEYFSSKYVYVAEYEKEGQDGRILVEVSSYDENTLQVEELGYLILDRNLKVVEDTLGMGKSEFTQREFNYYVGIDEEYEGLGIYKYKFTNNDGQTYTMVMHVEEISEENYEKYSSLYNLQIPIFLFCYVILIIIFIFWMNQKVKKPLDTLNTAMLDFANGKRDGKLEYSGASEFVQISTSFNIMSEKLTESEKNKQQLMEEKQKILADISHDLRTPITVIQGYAKAVNDGLIAEDEKERYLNTIYHKANGLAELIQIFYDYSKLEHPDFALAMEKRDLCEFVREYLAFKYEEVDMAGFLLEAEIPTQPILVEFDAIQMKRVFENIIGNSLKHNKRGTTILLEIKLVDNSIWITVGDDGVGIPEEIVATLFEPFVVGDESRNNKQGSGLGLAIAKRIVEAHGGSIELVQPLPSHYGMTTEIRIKLGR